MSTGIRNGVILNGRYRVCNLIGSGGFGEVFKAVDNKNHGKVVAVKACMEKPAQIEIKDQERVSTSTPVKRKKKVEVEADEAVCEVKKEFWALKHLENYPGFPRVYAQGIYHGQHYMVMEKLGRSLGDIFKSGFYNMSLVNLLLIVDQCLERIKHIHEMGMIHGDIKPDNMMMGVGENAGTLYFIDFGLASSFWDYEAGKHLEPRGHVNQGGTNHFMSVNVHAKLQTSRKDDLESFTYVLAFLLMHKKLPWRNYIDECSNAALGKMKKDTKEEVLFFGYPKEFAIFYNEVRNLEFSATPQYDSYRKMFRRLGSVFGINYETQRPDFR